MSFRLTTIFWVFAVVASAIATFGPGGIVAAALVLGFWLWMYYVPKRSTWVQLLNVVVVAVFILGVLVALLLPAVSSARPAAFRNQCMNNLKQISLALLNYENVNGSFPPAYVADANGKPMHSWRVLILPFLEEQALFKNYSFSEPWDGPNNSKLATQIPDIYRCPSQSNDKTSQPAETRYFAIVDPETAWPGSVGRRLREFTDGTSKTILAMEASGLHANWMEPRDVSLSEAIELLTTKRQSGHMHVSDNFLTTTYYETSDRNVAFCDGSIHWLGQFGDPGVAKALLTAAGGEILSRDLRGKYYREDVTRTVVNWGTVYALSTFVILSLLPYWWKRRPAVQLNEDAAGEPLARG